MKQFIILAIAAVAVSLAACNNGSSPSPTPTLGPTCAPPAGTQVALVYPAPNSTGVVNSNGEIVIGSTIALPVNQPGENWDIWYSDAVTGGLLAPLNQGTTLAAASPPFPTPNATPSFPNPQYQQQSSGVQFASGQTVNVYVNNLSSTNNCTPLLIGAFST
jgi:hypothetical protein